MDATTRITDAVQDRFSECITLRTCPGRDSVHVSVRWSRGDDWQATMFTMCDDYLVALADNGDQIADISTCWNDDSGPFGDASQATLVVSLYHPFLGLLEVIHGLNDSLIPPGASSRERYNRKEDGESRQA